MIETEIDIEGVTEIETEKIETVIVIQEEAPEKETTGGHMVIGMTVTDILVVVQTAAEPHPSTNEA